jgi:hypothetical protein
MGTALESWVASYGVYFVFLATFVSCLWATIPAIVVLLTANLSWLVSGLVAAGLWWFGWRRLQR